MSFRIFGQVFAEESGEGLANLTVRATDKDLLVNDYLGAATTDENGRFEIRYEEKDFMDLLFDRKPDIFLEVSDQQGTLIHTTKDAVRYEAGESEEFIIKIPGRDDMDDQVELERLEFKQLLLENPNYFGTYPELDFEPVKPMQGNTKYEALRCLGFYPEEDLLEAVLDVKLSTGYGGGLCTAGSYEYVRFYVDWDGDDDFSDPDEDAGIVSVNVHNIPNEEGKCRDKAKPLSYALKLRVQPEKLVCRKPYLVKVRAILEWDNLPPAGTPDHMPIWGNVLEKWIQIEPREHFFGDFIDPVDLGKFGLKASMIDLKTPVSKSAAVSIEELRERYQDKDVPEQRFNIGQLAPIVAQIKEQPTLLLEYQKDPAFANIAEAIEALLYAKPEVKYEELTCLGLHYDQDTLAATIRVKLPDGYMGDLCDDGSYEHVAFWVRVYDKIEQQCVWRYLGTSSVNVHDIDEIPDEGLQYAVYLQSDFSAWKRACNNAVVLQVRGVLSWKDLPSTTDPYWEPKWGNVKDALIQLKPDDPTIPGHQKPYIWSVGEMAVESISGNPYTTLPSIIGNGYANGVSVGGGFVAIESPFGQRAKITGTITNAPDISSGAAKLKYKVQYLKVGSGTGWHDIDNSFTIWLRVNGVPSGPMAQTATGGYYDFQKDLVGLVKYEVQDDVLAQWDTHKADGDGLYLLRLLLYQVGAPAMPGVPADHVSSKIIRVMVDNTPPKAKISLDAGPCTKFQIGDTFNGKFTATDKHIWRYRISVLPGTADPPIITPPASQTYPLLTPPGKVDEPYVVTTTASTTPCGYVIFLHVRDRTIVNNHFPGHPANDSVGLCLLEEAAEEGSE